MIPIFMYLLNIAASVVNFKQHFHPFPWHTWKVTIKAKTIVDNILYNFNPQFILYSSQCKILSLIFVCRVTHPSIVIFIQHILEVYGYRKTPFLNLWNIAVEDAIVRQMLHPISGHTQKVNMKERSMAVNVG